MDSLASLYKNHIVTLQERTRDVLARFKLDALLIHSGELMNTFLDDHAYPFKVNPQFKASGACHAGSKLLAAGGWREQAETVVLPAGRLLAQRGAAADLILDRRN